MNKPLPFRYLFLAAVLTAYVADVEAQETKRVIVTETYTTSVPANTIDKVTAVRTLINNKDAVVYKCQLVELTDKVTLKKRKAE